MKVAIIGAGAVGLLIASYLSEANVETILYTRRAEQANLINQNGIQLKKGDQAFCYRVSARTLEAGNHDEDLIIITVKQYDVHSIIEYLKEYKIEQPVLFMQNGMSHVNDLPNLTSNSVLVGIVEHGAQKRSDLSVEHTGKGQMKLACFKGQLAETMKVWEALNSIDFPVKVEDNWYPMLAKKLLVNAIINPLTALYKVRNGELIKNPFYLRCMKELHQEIMPILLFTKEDNTWYDVERICVNTAKNYSSMYTDIMNGRPTEVDAILGYLLEEAKAKHQNLPLVSFLYKSIKGMERMGEEMNYG